jgi:hypothetical protein
MTELCCLLSIHPFFYMERQYIGQHHVSVWCVCTPPSCHAKVCPFSNTVYHTINCTEIIKLPRERMSNPPLISYYLGCVFYSRKLEEVLHILTKVLRLRKHLLQKTLQSVVNRNKPNRSPLTQHVIPLVCTNRTAKAKPTVPKLMALQITQCIKLKLTFLEFRRNVTVGSV